jgi:hypothetical protein
LPLLEDRLPCPITNFNAVNILVQYFAGAGSHYDNISAKIVVAPPVDKCLLPWQELFTDPKLFPTGIEWDDPRANANISNANILEFLDNALETSSQVKSAKTAWSKRDLKNTNLALKSLKSSNVLGWSIHAEKLLEKLKQLKSPEAAIKPKRKLVEEGPDNNKLFHEITEGIQSLSESAMFINSLVDGQIFLGTLHCEVCLASLLSEKATVSEGVLEQMHVGYVSNLFLLPMSFL